MFNLNEGLLWHIFGGLALAENELWKFYATYILFVIVSIALAYLLGSINSAIIISRVFYHDDIRKHGSGNAGLTNMLRTYGLKAAGGTLLGDILKTALAIFIAGFLLGFNYVAGISTVEGYCYLAGLFAVIGHVFPIYYKFKGGKGVLATATMALILSPIPFLILITVFILIVCWTKYVSLGSVVGAILYPVSIHAYFAIAFGSTTPAWVSVSTIALALLIVWCHRGNLKRIQDRTERKISFKKKPEVQSTNEEAEEGTDGEEN